MISLNLDKYNECIEILIELVGLLEWDLIVTEPGERAVFDSLLAIFAPSIAIFQMIHIAFGHECKYGLPVSLLTLLSWPVLDAKSSNSMLQFNAIHFWTNKGQLLTAFWSPAKASRQQSCLHEAVREPEYGCSSRKVWLEAGREQRMDVEYCWRE